MADNNNETTYNKVQINYDRTIGKDRWGKPIEQTRIMFNIREEDPEKAVELYRQLKEKFFQKEV